MPNTNWTQNKAFEDALKTFDDASVLFDDTVVLFDGYNPSLVQPKQTNWTPA